MENRPTKPQRSKLAHIIRGCGYVPHCGSHPGTAFIILFPLIGAVAGLDKGITGALFGFGVFALLFGPIYLKGAYERSKLSDALEEKES